jgi:hypothetical protein
VAMAGATRGVAPPDTSDSDLLYRHTDGPGGATEILEEINSRVSKHETGVKASLA